MSILINDGNTEDRKVVKCDIGEFVLSYVKLKKILNPVLKLSSYLITVFKWKHPLHTIFWMVVITCLTFYNPVYLLISCLLPIPPLLVFEFMRVCSKRTVLDKKYVDYFERRGELHQQKLKQAEEELWKEHLRIYLDILIKLHQHFLLITTYLEFIKSIVAWKKPRTSLIVLLVSLAFELALYTVEFRFVLLFCILAIFLVNRYFVIAIQSSWLKLSNSLKSLFLKRKESLMKEVKVEVQLTNTIQVSAEAQGEDEEPTANDAYYYHNTSSSSNSDTEEDAEDSTSKKMTSRPSNKGGSLTKFFPPSFRRRYMKKENCTNCEQPSSTILTKRRYCRQCGHSFCSRCCHTRLPRALLGATAPAAYQEKVLVCIKCHIFLTNRSKTEL